MILWHFTRTVSYLRSLVVRAVHWHRTGVGSIPAGGSIVDEFFSTVPVRISTCAYFHSILRHILTFQKYLKPLDKMHDIQKIC